MKNNQSGNQNSDSKFGFMCPKSNIFYDLSQLTTEYNSSPQVKIQVQEICQQMGLTISQL